MKREAIFHGEVILFRVDGLPENAEKINIKKDYFTIADSETLHNDHRVSVDERTKFFTKDDILFLETLGTKVYCPNEVKHTAIEIPAGTWQIGHAVDVDHLTEHVNRVRD